MSKITITNIIFVDNINKCKWLVDGVCSNYKGNFICPCFCTRPQSKGIDCTEGCCEFFEKENDIIE